MFRKAYIKIISVDWIGLKILVLQGCYKLTGAEDTAIVQYHSLSLKRVSTLDQEIHNRNLVLGKPMISFSSGGLTFH